MKATPGRPIKTGNLSDYKNPKLVIIEKCTGNTYWYSCFIGTMFVVAEEEGGDFCYNVLEKMKNGKFAYGGRNIIKKDVSYICDVT